MTYAKIAAVLRSMAMPSLMALLIVIAAPGDGSASSAVVTRQAERPVRALHANVRGVKAPDILKIINRAASARLNTLILVLASDTIAFESLSRIRTQAQWKPADVDDVIAYAKKNGIEIVPEIKLLTHQQNLLGTSYPEYMYNARTYDPGKNELYERIVYPLLDEVIATYRPRAVLIGHDEVVGWNPRHAEKVLSAGDRPLPAELFVKDVIKIHSYLRKRGVQVWMWGDMLLSPEELPTMLPRHLHGSMPGYGKELRQKLPKDIVVCDWHYFDEQADFPSIDAFRKDGFRVLGATWGRVETIRNFSAYASSHGAAGMVATLWTYLTKREWETVNEIIDRSGALFLGAFPDGR